MLGKLSQTEVFIIYSFQQFYIVNQNNGLLQSTTVMVEEFASNAGLDIEE